MKTKILKLSLITLLFSFISAGCQKDDIFELDIGDENAVILKEIDGIEFKFCLLNEQGEPATVFDEGENLTFFFLCKNEGKDTITFDRGFIGLPEFCEVINQEGEKIGSPFIKPVIQELIGRGAYPFQPQREYIFEVPWMDNREEWYKWHGMFKSANQGALSKGKYYTKFRYQFDFGAYSTDRLTFKINFEIK